MNSIFPYPTIRKGAFNWAFLHNGTRITIRYGSRLVESRNNRKFPKKQYHEIMLTQQKINYTERDDLSTMCIGHPLKLRSIYTKSIRDQKIRQWTSVQELSSIADSLIKILDMMIELACAAAKRSW